MSLAEKKPLKKEDVVIKEYKIASISIFEFMIYLSYWLVFLLGGCYHVYILGYKPQTLKYFKTSGYLKKSYFGLYQSEYEYIWPETIVLFKESWKSFAIYIVISRFLRSTTTPTIFMSGCIAMALVINYTQSTKMFLAAEMAILLLLGVSGLFRKKSLVWIIGLILLYNLPNIVASDFFSKSYIFQSSFSYLALLITRGITVGLVIADSEKVSGKLCLEMIFYYWYFPALMGCRMMSAKQFVDEIYKPYIITNWKKWTFLAVRILFWFHIWKIVASLVPFYLVLLTHDIKELSIFIIIGGQLFYGVHFGMVYIIIYNTSYLLTQLDGFRTADGPECISHIALYNRMWKAFDVGLHLWVKEYIYRPIAASGSYSKTRILSTLASFGFVIVFHGSRNNTIVWICLNVLQFAVHTYLVHAFSNCEWGEKVQRNFSPAIIRKFIALAGAISWFTSICGFGLFSYGFANYKAMFMNVMKTSSNQYYYRPIMYAILCYCHAEICLTVNDYLLKRKKKVQ